MANCNCPAENALSQSDPACLKHTSPVCGCGMVRGTPGPHFKHAVLL